MPKTIPFRRLRVYAIRPVVVVVLISSLLAPAGAVGGLAPAGPGAERSSGPQAPPPPHSDPPQPFAVGEPVGDGGGVFDSIGREAREVWHGPVLPEEFRAAARVPGLFERFAGKIASLIGRTGGEGGSPAALPPAPPTATPEFDFDGDGAADAGRWNPAAAQFAVRRSGSGGAVANYTLGTSAGKPAPADYDGDGKTDLAVFDAGTWTVRKSSDGTTATVTGFGQAGDVPVSANFTGAGADDNLAVYRPSTGMWYWREFAGGTVSSTQYGVSSDIPAPGDYDGDGDAEPAVYRPHEGVWYVSSIGGIQWGVAADIPVPADYSGDGRTEIAVYRPSSGTWWALNPADWSYTAENWGNYADQPAPADYDGDGKADRAVWRPTSGVWFVNTSGAGADVYYSLGAAGDLAVPSAYVKQVGGSAPASALSLARLAPRNATGGTDLHSQNFSWGTSLVSLPGRSGLDLHLGLSYNSLVWTKEGSAVHFDADRANVSPGFNLGFPTVEQPFYDAASGKWNFLMLAPSGARVRFRQVGAGSTYETLDSSYMQLKMDPADSPADPPKEIEFEVLASDGTRMSFAWAAGAYRCVRVADRNGNYISAAYDEHGSLESATDTLGRVVAVDYDAQLYPTSVTQTWKAGNGAGASVTHAWATFAYATVAIDTDFAAGIAVAGPPDGTQLKVLEKVTRADGSWTKFLYNGYGQVKRVETYAADGHLLGYTRTNLDAVAAGQTDCPRFTATATWTENFNSGSETTATITRSTGQGYTSPAGDSATPLTRIEVAMTGHPHNAVSKTWYGESGWMDGLPIATEDWADGTSGSELKRWTWTDYEQDKIEDKWGYAQAVNYRFNPRVTQVKVGDAANVKRTTMEYLRPVMPENGPDNAIYGLVSAVNVYAADQSTITKRMETHYNLSFAYTDRRIIGLPAATESWGRNDLTGSLELVSKVTYAYDEGGFGDSSLQQTIAPVQHDSTNYGPSFAHRGNPTSTTRWDVTQPTNAAAAVVTATLKYNTAGSVVARITPWDGTNTRTVRIGYADSWNSTGNPLTYAYPTVVTDPAGSTLGAAGHSSTVKYRYDIGANVEATSPAPAGNAHGKTTKRIYDPAGRLVRDSVYVNAAEHSYVRYEYPTNGIQSKTYAPMVDVDGDGDIAEDEVYSESWHDGAGRVRMARTEHPGSTGGWAATLTEYDILGRVKRQSVPTEVSVSGPAAWAPAGDDAARGFLWTHQRYDWMGRVVRRINTDGDPLASANDSDVFVSYAGCGCAGGLITTVEGELVPRDDQPNVKARRTQKIFADILGRSWKTVVYKWDGTTAYTMTERAFNGRDQVVRTRQTDNTATANPQTYQDVTMSYDGHARMKTRHYPIEDANTNTTWNYNPDGSISQIIDPRGATTDLTYNSRGLTTQIAYTPPANPPQHVVIPDTPNITFTYDDLGNRTSMTDGSGTLTYSYDPLSRITSETKDFADLANNMTIS